jgi:uncharacterized ParB-like nuclease family protein
MSLMDIELSPNPRANILAIVAILGILIALALIIYASDREVEQYGPTALVATQDDRLYFDAARHIYEATQAGSLLERESFDQLGIEGPIAQLSMHKGDLVLLDTGENQVKRCDTSIWRCTPLVDAYTEQPSDILSFALSTEDNRLYLAIGGGHRIVAYDLEGQKLYTLTVPKGLKYVNDLQWLGDNRLLVTDTNHHRVIELHDLGEGKVDVALQLKAENTLGHKGRKWPTEAQRDSEGGTWVINCNGMLRKGDLIFYDHSGKAQSLIDLGVDTELSALTLYPDGVLVSDSKKPQLLFISRSDFSISQLHQDSLQASLKTISLQRSFWQNVYYFGFAVLIAFLILGVIAGYLDWQARRDLHISNQVEKSRFVDGEWIIPDNIKTRVSPDQDGIYWLSLKPESLSKFKIITFIFPFMLAWLFYFILFDTDEGLKSPLLLTGALLLLLYLALLWFLHIALPRLRIGTNGKELFLVDFLGRKSSDFPEGCIRTQSRLLIGIAAVPIKQQGPMLFDEELFRVLIEPMLEQVPKTNEFLLIWRNLRNGDPATWLGLVAIAFILAKHIWLQ